MVYYTLLSMDKKIVLANWKSHKTVQETIAFLKALHDNLSTIDLSNKFILICPTYISLASAAAYIQQNNLPLSLCAQDISAFGEGAYTGEVAGRFIKEFATHVLIGHSERLKYNHETVDDIQGKIVQAKEANLTPILCIQNENSFIGDVPIIAYEPPTAISTFGVGKAETSSDVESVFTTLKQKTQASLLYGGSVDADNVSSYMSSPVINGLLVGGASLDPQTFIALLSKW